MIEQLPRAQVDPLAIGARGDLEETDRVRAEGEQVGVQLTPSSLKTSAQIEASEVSSGVCGAANAFSFVGQMSGAGNAARSSFPFGVSGREFKPDPDRRDHVLRQVLGET